MKKVFQRLWFLLIFLLIATGLVWAVKFNVLKVFAADSPWTQTDWSGGVGSSTVNQFESSTDINFSTSGQFTLNSGDFQIGNFKGTQLSNGATNFNVGSLTAVKWNYSQYYNADFFDYDSGEPTRMVIKDDGDYFASLTIDVEGDGVNDSANRTAIEAQVWVNGEKKDVGRAASTYLRNYSGHFESSAHLGVLLEDLEADDYVEIFVIRSTTDTAHPLSAKVSLLAEKIADSESVFSATATTTDSGTNLNGSERTLIWDQSRIDSGYTHTDSSSSIVLDSSGDYFVAVNVPLGSSVQRANIRGKIKLDGTQVDGAEFKQGYIRSYNNHYDSSIHWSGIVSPTGDGETMTITVAQEGASGTVTVDGEKATVYIKKIEDTSGLYYSEATQAGGSDNWNPSSAQSINWADDLLIDSSVYSHSTSSNNHEITVQEAGDYVLSFNSAQSGSVSRGNPKTVVQVNGSDVWGAETKSGYIRTSGHEESSNNLLFLLEDLSANDVISLTVEAEAVGGTLNDSTPAVLMLQKKGLPAFGTLTSNVFDAGFSADWAALTYTTSGNGTVIVKARSDSNSDMSTATDWDSCDAIVSGADMSSNNCISDMDQYIQYKVQLQPSSGEVPVFEDISLAFAPSDVVNPTNNASGVDFADVATGEWYKEEPTISWSAGADNVGGSGLLGYCVALDGADPGLSSALDPVTSAGALAGKDDGVSQDYCPFIVTGTSLDLSSVAGLDLVSGKQYYFSIKAVDIAGNIYSGSSENYQDLDNFKYDGTPPTNPAGLSASQTFLNNVEDFIIYWITTGPSAASDAHSGIKGYQYRIGQNGTWYGAGHTGDEDCDDIITDGYYTLNSDYDSLEEGDNTFYLRAYDNACNPTANMVTAVLKYSGNSPSNPQNLAVTPSSNDENSFAFDWITPNSFSGQESGLTYCYTINTVPSSFSCTWTSEIALTADAYASLPGTNTFYVVARDEANNVNYDSYNSIDFECNTSAPGVPRGVDVADISIKSTSNWKLAVSWEAPEDVGAGVENYQVYRSTSSTSCTDSFSSFDLAGTTAGTSYTDTGLNQDDYYYCVKACDSASNCSAVSSTVTNYPDGKFTEAAELVSDPDESGITTKRATISWTTDRVSDSKVSYGKKSGDYYDEEPSNSEQVTSHEINLTSLDPGTRYYYKVKWTDEDGNTGTSTEQNFKTDEAPSVGSVEATNVGIESAYIKFEIENASEAEIMYGESTSYGGIVSTTTSTSESTHNLLLDGLKDGTTYHYKIILYDSEEEEYEFEDHQFTTLPRPHISKVRIQQVKNTAQPTVLVSWETNTEVSSIVSYYPQNDPGAAREEIKSELTKGEHQVLLRGLLPHTPYSLQVRGVDKAGNQAVSDSQKFTTATDTRPPAILKLNVEGSNVPTTEGQEGSISQLVVSWNTDEPATSQVEFGEGTGTVYSQKTQEDSNLTYNHLVVVSNLVPSKVYHLKAISKDEVGNESKSIDTVTITPKATDNALDLVVGNLREVFGFIGN